MGSEETEQPYRDYYAGRIGTGFLPVNYRGPPKVLATMDFRLT
jgi:hypothetical protein